ncbi:hypothetical protein [Mycolicibacterium elephantis]
MARRSCGRQTLASPGLRAAYDEARDKISRLHGDVLKPVLLCLSLAAGPLQRIIDAYTKSVDLTQDDFADQRGFL